MSSQTVRTLGSGIVFVNTYDATDTTAFQNCIVAAEKTIESLWTNTVTLNISFTEANNGNNNIALGNSLASYVNVSYAKLTGALPAGDSLPSADPNSSGGADWALPEAYARMLGLSSSAPAVDDAVTLNTFYNWSFGQDVINGLIHEISEGAMGRIGGLGDKNGIWSTMDLFRYSSAGVHDYSDGRDGKTSYFSSDGSTLSSGAGLTFNNDYTSFVSPPNGGDPADWTQTDVFGGTNTAETLTLTQTELDVMDALGWTPVLQQDVFTAGSANWQTPTDWSNGSMPISPEDAFIGVLTASTATSNANVTVNSIGTNTQSTLIVGGASTFVATAGTVLNPSRTYTFASGNLGAIDVDVGSTLEIGGAFDNVGSVEVGAPVGRLLFGGSSSGALGLTSVVTLNGGGAMTLGYPGSGIFLPATSASITGVGLTNVDNTIAGAGTIFLVDFDNQASGKVEANRVGGPALQVAATTFTNEGSMIAQTGATLDLGQDGTNHSLTNNGSIEVDAGSDLAISGNLAIAGGGSISMKGAGAEITSDGTAAATFTNEGKIEAFDSGQIGDVGLLGANDLSFVNTGTVAVAGPGQLLTLDTGANAIGDGGGTLEAEDGATLAIDSDVDTGVIFSFLKHPAGTIEAASGGIVTLAAAVQDGIPVPPLSLSGQILIAGGRFDMLSGASDTDPIDFSGAGGTLEVDSAGTTLGAISGAVFGDFIDARFLPFSPAVAARFVPDAGGASGVLTLSDGVTAMNFVLDVSGPLSFSATSDGAGGTQIEVLNPRARGDLSGDGKSDILFLNPNGQVAQWQMSGASVIGGGVFDTLSPGYTVSGIGDFNGDGYADMLLSTAAGALSVMDLNGTQMIGGGSAGLLGAGWSLGPTGDFTGDGMADILFQNSSGALGMWEMSNAQVIGGGIFAALGAGSGWSLAGTGDFNGDGKSDILLQNTNGQIALWEMNGVNVIGGGVVGSLGAGSGWSVAGVGDFNGDGFSDILLANANGALAMWEMNGVNVAGGGIFQSLGANAGWSVAAVGDYDGDGKSDILLHNVSGATQIWEMNAMNVVGGGPTPPIGAPWIVEHP